MAFAGRPAEDLARIAEHLLVHDVTGVEDRLAEIIDALEVLTRHPLIGRKVANNRRELVIGRGARGYVALHAYDIHTDLVAIAALLAQREAGFASP
ncbi:MAG: type II toxin-antitoxin system RelE/ParE family toxin [Rubrivivax sp.]